MQKKQNKPSALNHISVHEVVVKATTWQAKFHEKISKLNAPIFSKITETVPSPHAGTDSTAAGGWLSHSSEEKSPWIHKLRTYVLLQSHLSMETAGQMQKKKACVCIYENNVYLRIYMYTHTHIFY